MGLKGRLSALIWVYFHPYRVKPIEITALFVNVPTILGDQKYWDKFTYMCIKVVKSLVFGSILLARNDYVMLANLQTCWMHLLFVLGVFQITLCQIEINGK